MQVTQEQGQVCYELVKLVVRKEGIRNFGQDAVRELGNMAKRINCRREDIAPLISAIITELAEETCTAFNAIGKVEPKGSLIG